MYSKMDTRREGYGPSKILIWFEDARPGIGAVLQQDRFCWNW
jgi:hypothetical protein